MFKHSKLIIGIVVFSIVSAIVYIRLSQKVESATLTSSSVTLSNSRMSFKAPISSGAAGSQLITISGSAPDTTTNHLFPGDKVCFTDAGNNVCRDNTTYTVGSIVNATQFNITSPLVTALASTDYAVASQSGTWTIAFTTVSSVPVGGKLTITIPANDTNTPAQNNNGMPDSSGSVSTNGFDMNGLAVGGATVTGGCTPANWGSSGAATSITVGGSGTTDTVISWTRASSSCVGGTPITITIGSPYIVNPAPITGHTQGQADVYGVTIATTDGTNILDSVVPRVAPIEAVLISATVDQSLSFTVASIGASQTACGKTTSVATTATSVPWGHLGTPNSFNYAAQQLTVSTNASNGYAVTIQENDQMGLNGNTCPGTSPSSGEYTFTAGHTCIRDTACGSTPCTYATTQDWITATYDGLGYSLASQSGTDAVFYYGEQGRAFSARDLPDINSYSAQNIMYNAAPVSGSSAYVCYGITITGTQPAGYYYNTVKYTATAVF